MAVMSLLLVIACGESDPRNKLFLEDRKNLMSAQYSGIVALSKELGSLYTGIGNKALKPETWDVFTREMDDRMLVVIRIPKLKKSVKDSRLDFLKITEGYLRKQPRYKDRKMCLAIQGSIMIDAALAPGTKAIASPSTSRSSSTSTGRGRERLQRSDRRTTPVICTDDGRRQFHATPSDTVMPRMCFTGDTRISRGHPPSDTA